MEKLENFYRTRADFPDWMTEEEWNKKEIEIIKECLEPKIKQTMEELFNGIKCPLSVAIEYDEENELSVKIKRQGDELDKQEEYYNSFSRHSDGIRIKGKRQMFTIDGSGYFNKRSCVLEVVKRYMRQYPETTSQQLMQVFPAEVQGGYGVVRSVLWVHQQQQLGKDFLRRYYMDSKDLINTSDGIQFAVSNQWGDTFQRFVDCAKKVGVEIKEI